MVAEAHYPVSGGGFGCPVSVRILAPALAEVAWPCFVQVDSPRLVVAEAAAAAPALRGRSQTEAHEEPQTRGLGAEAVASVPCFEERTVCKLFCCRLLWEEERSAGAQIWPPGRPLAR